MNEPNRVAKLDCRYRWLVFTTIAPILLSPVQTAVSSPQRIVHIFSRKSLTEKEVE